MPRNGHLMPVGDLVGHTWVIGADFEPFCMEVYLELAIEEEYALKEAIYGLLEFNIGQLLP